MKTIGKYAFSALMVGLAAGSALSANAWSNNRTHDVSSTRPRGNMNDTSSGTYRNDSTGTTNNGMYGNGSTNGTSGNMR